MMQRNIQIQPFMLSEVTPHCFVTEASTAGLRPGEWPVLIGTVTGNRHDFMLRQTREDGARVYDQLNGCTTLIILND